MCRAPSCQTMKGAEVWGLIYLLWTTMALAAAVDQWRRQKRGPLRVTALLTCSLALRTAWMFKHPHHHDETLVMRVVNRVSILLQFLVVSMLVLAWAKILAKTPRERELGFALFVIANVVGWVTTLAISSATAEDNLLFRIDLALISSLYAISGIVLAVYSLQMRSELERQSLSLGLESLHLDKATLAVAQSSRPAQIHEVKVKLQVCSLGLVVCFSIRALAFIYEALSDRNMLAPWGIPLVVYPYSFYEIPELIPDAIVVSCVTNYVRWSELQQRFANWNICLLWRHRAEDWDYSALNSGSLNAEDADDAGVPRTKVGSHDPVDAETI